MGSNLTDRTVVDGDDELRIFTGADAPIAAYMTEEVTLADAATTLRDAAVLLDTAGVGILAVGSREQVEGVVSERDILRAVALGVDLDTATVGDIESRELRWATPESTVGDVVEEMMEGYIRHVLVGDELGLRGIVSMRDLLAALVT